jgi:glycosyltransferase involved in cell wall biosynthesis
MPLTGKKRASITATPKVNQDHSRIRKIFTQTAYLHSLSVIATDVGGLPELVIHGKTGIIVRPKDPKALASAIETLLSDDDKRCCYGRNGNSLLEADLTWDRVSERLLEIYAAS